MKGKFLIIGFVFDLKGANVGITLSPSIQSSYDEMDVAQVYLDGINW